jgi:alkyl hydroperoxide reductase subunit AhpC
MKTNPAQITINDLPVGRSVDETLRLIDAFQFTDKYGEVSIPSSLYSPHKQTLTNPGLPRKLEPR